MIRAALFAALFLALVGPLTAGLAAVWTGEIGIGGQGGAVAEPRIAASDPQARTRRVYPERLPQAGSRRGRSGREPSGPDGPRPAPEGVNKP